MLRALWFLLKLGLFVGAAVWLAAQPGQVEIVWMDYTAHIRGGFFALILVAVILLAVMIYAFLRGLAGMPARWRALRGRRRQDKGYRALTRGLSAIAAGDTAAAAQQAAMATRYLPGDQGLAILLEAQVARLQKRPEEARQHFERLLALPDTAFLGARGLLQEALREGDEARARRVMQKALALQPRQGWLLQVSYELATRAGDWKQALRILTKLQQSGDITAAAAASENAAIMIAQADDFISLRQYAQAHSQLRRAMRLRPHFTPAIKRAVRLHMLRGRRGAAEKLLRREAPQIDHPDIPVLWEAVMKPRKKPQALDRYQWMEELLRLHPSSASVLLALGRLAMEQKLWGEARQHFQQALSLEPSQQAVNLLAELADRSGQTVYTPRQWQEKIEQAPPDKTWVCTRTGRTYPAWEAIALPHKDFNSMIWQAPQNITLAPPGAVQFLLAGGDHARAADLLEAPL